MPSNHPSHQPGNDDNHGDSPRAAGPDSGPGVGQTRQLLSAVHGPGAASHDRLYDEVCRRNPGKEFDPSELVECSVKLSRRGFSAQRHGGSISWSPDERGTLAASALRAAPSDAVQQALQALAAETDTGRAADPGSGSGGSAAEDSRLAALREWVQKSTRFFSAIAYDYDAKLYKLYLFKHRPVSYFEELDLLGRLRDLPALSYIRSMEVPFDAPHAWHEALYFKLRFAELAPDTVAAGRSGARRKLTEILAADYRPHPLLSARLLADVPKRDALVESLSKLLTDVQAGSDPVIKLVPPDPPSADAPADQLRRDFLALGYGVNVNLLDPARIRFLETQQATVLQIAEALGCQDQAKAWLKQVARFDCFISYLGLGPDSVTLYYRSTNLHRRKPAPHFRRG